MPLTLQNIFGNNAFQDLDNLIIDKSDLFRLSASENNTAESLLVAILIKSLANYEGYLTDTANKRIVDANGRDVSYRFDDYTESDLFYWKRQYMIEPTYCKILDTFILQTYEIFTDAN